VNDRKLVVLLLLIPFLVASRASAATLYVAPDGDDRWSGHAPTPNANRTDGPLASMKGARDAVRRLKALQRAPEPVHVLFAGGIYALDAEVRFTPADSGTAAAPIFYEAAKGERPIFTGGRTITGFRADKGGVWKAKVPGAADGKWTFGQLFVNDRRATRARTPNKFYHYMAGAVGHGIDPLTGKAATLTNRAFVARPADIQPLLKLPPTHLRDVVLVAYHSWAVSLLRPAAVDPKTNVVVTTGPARWPFLRWGPSQRYHLENFREALDAPGEWFLDRDGWLHYLPRKGEDMTTARVVAPVLSTFVSLAGEPKLGRFVEHITFRGLSFRHGRYVVPPEGISDAQAAVTIPGVIMVDNARHVALEDCEVAHVGSYAIWFRRGNRHCRVERCFIHDLGAGGVRMGEGWDNEDLSPIALTSHTVVDNNIIRNGGRLFRGAIGVWIGHSSDNRVTHNDIADFRYTGISVGWQWLYKPSVAKRNTIDFNHIHHLGWGVMSDMGGVYTLGQSEGTTVSNNVIHDVNSYDRYGRGGWGLYNDQASMHIVMENNLVYRVKTGCYHLHFGRYLTVRNNIFAFSMDGQIQHSKTDPQHPSFSAFERNIVYWDEGPVHSRSRWEDRKRFRSSLYHCTKSNDPVFSDGMKLKQWRAKGEDAGSILADPMFVDPKRGDFRLKPGSPAAKIGFKPFDYSMAGVYGDPAWVRKASEVKYPPVQFAPEPPPAPPLTFSEDFEAVPVGAALVGAKVYGAEKGASVAVTDRTKPAGGKRCLAITDQAGLSATYNPHFYYQPKHTKGITRLAFDIRLSADAQVHHEWRDTSKPYQVGPSLRIADGKMQIRGKPPLALPVDKWVRVEISAGMGPAATGTWDLTVNAPGQPPVKHTKLPYGRGKMKTLQWLGFSSLATKRTVYHLDNINLTNE
jgi:hypothetical protein